MKDRYTSLFTSAALIATVFVGLLLYMAPQQAEAASDGSLGPTSTGSFSVSITVPTRVMISKMDDLAFGTWTASGDMAQDDDVCVYTSDATGRYKVTLTGNGPSGEFQVDDGNSNIASYQVWWNDEKGTVNGVQVSSGTALASQTTACTSNSSCSGCGSNSANFKVKFTSAELSSAIAGSYTGTLSIVVEPD